MYIVEVLSHLADRLLEAADIVCDHEVQCSEVRRQRARVILPQLVQRRLRIVAAAVQVCQSRVIRRARRGNQFAGLGQEAVHRGHL